MKRSLKKYSYPFPDKSGSVLILVIWMLVFFSILGAALYSITTSYISLFRRLEDRAVGRYIAHAACIDVKMGLNNGKIITDTLYDLRKDREAELGLGKFVYKLVDEESKLNINSASKDMLMRLDGIDEKAADKILASNLRPFKVREELLLVDGVEEEDYEKFKDYITVYSERGVNINTAPAKVLELVGMTESLAQAVSEYRAGPDGKEGTEDDAGFKSVGEIIPKLRSYISFSSAEEAALVSLISQQVLTAQAANFSVECDAKILNRTAMKYVIVLNKERIKEWREY